MSDPTQQAIERRRGMDELVQNGTQIKEEVAGLRVMFEEFAAAAGEIVNRQEFQRSRSQLFLAIAGLVVILGGFSIFNLLVLNSANESLRVIEDCTQPQGRCYQRNEERTREAIKQITDAHSKGLQRLECILLIEPSERTAARVDRCKVTE